MAGITQPDAQRDREILAGLNARFIEAFRQGSWELLRPILSPKFSYLDGATGEVWPMDRYIADLDGHAVPTIDIDQVRIHVDGRVAVVSARSFKEPGRFNRYVDTYERRPEGWSCVHACVWPLGRAVEEGHPGRRRDAGLTGQGDVVLRLSDRVPDDGFG